MLFIRDAGTLTILSGSSGAASLPVADDAYAIGIQAPATLTATQAQVWVSAASSGGFAQLLSGGTAVVLGVAQAIVISPIPYRLVQVQSTSAEGGDRTFTVTKLVHV